MIAVIQRVNHAQLSIDSKIYSSIGKGFLVLLGIHEKDTGEDLNYIAKKILGLRIFSDSEGKMNLSLDQVHGEILLVSQFTLIAQTKKGNRPSFIEAAKPEIAIPLYEKMIKTLEENFQKKIKTGKFGSDMQIILENDGPVTILLDSKNGN